MILLQVGQERRHLYAFCAGFLFSSSVHLAGSENR